MPPPAKSAESLYFEAAQPLLQQGKFAEAIAILSAGTKYLKNSAQLELALGVAYYGLRRFDDAAGAFLRTIAIAPDIEQPYVFLGKFLDQIPAALAGSDEDSSSNTRPPTPRNPPDIFCTRRR